MAIIFPLALQHLFSRLVSLFSETAIFFPTITATSGVPAISTLIWTSGWCVWWFFGPFDLFLLLVSSATFFLQPALPCRWCFRSCWPRGWRWRWFWLTIAVASDLRAVGERFLPITSHPHSLAIATRWHKYYTYYPLNRNLSLEMASYSDICFSGICFSLVNHIKTMYCWIIYRWKMPSPWIDSCSKGRAEYMWHFCDQKVAALRNSLCSEYSQFFSLLILGYLSPYQSLSALYPGWLVDRGGEAFGRKQSGLRISDSPCITQWRNRDVKASGIFECFHFGIVQFGKIRSVTRHGRKTNR